MLPGFQVGTGLRPVPYSRGLRPVPYGTGLRRPFLSDFFIAVRLVRGRGMVAQRYPPAGGFFCDLSSRRAAEESVG
jgi:hypothetical protein